MNGRLRCLTVLLVLGKATRYRIGCSLCNKSLGIRPWATFSRVGAGRGKAKPQPLTNFQPSTGLGKFDVSYDPRAGVMNVSVRCSLDFVNGEETLLVLRSGRSLPTGAEPTSEQLAADPVDRVVTRPAIWTPEEKRRWRHRFFAIVKGYWSEQFTFWSTKDYWEDIHVLATVEAKEVKPDASPKDSPFYLQVTKGTDERSHLFGERGKRYGGKLNDQDVEPETLRGRPRNTVAHETGHMLGLGDEYVEPGAEPGQLSQHSPQVRAEYGHEVRRGTDPDSIMAEGALVGPEHGVTLLDALRAISGTSDWSHAPRPPKQPPATP